MPKYMFRLEHLHVFFQRSATSHFGDVYVATFGIEVGPRQIGPLGAFLNKKVPAQGTPGIESGDDIDLSAFPPDNPAGKWGTWDIGPVDISPTDTISVNYGFVNTSDSGSSISAGNQAKIVGATWTAILSVGLATDGVGAVVTAIVLGVGTVLSELLGDIIPDTPKCNGTAFGEKVILTGAELGAATNTPGQRMTVTRTSGNPDIPSNCGHASSAEITFSVEMITVESVKKFLAPQGDLSQGLKRGLKLTQTPISVRSLIED